MYYGQCFGKIWVASDTTDMHLFMKYVQIMSDFILADKKMPNTTNLKYHLENSTLVFTYKAMLMSLISPRGQ